MVAEVLDVLDAVRSPDEIPPAPPLTVTRHLAAVGPSGEAALDAVIEEFLPQQADEAQTRAWVEAAISATGAASMRDMGRVMGTASARFAGRADGKAISALVRQHLA